MFLPLSNPSSHLLPSCSQLLLLLILIAAVGAGSGGAAGCRGCCLRRVNACSVSRRALIQCSPGTQSGVLGTFPPLSSFNYGPIMKAARSTAAHHTLREGGGGGGRSHPPSPPHITSVCSSTSLLSVLWIPFFSLYLFALFRDFYVSVLLLSF